jgi:hypothetical protein
MTAWSFRSSLIFVLLVGLWCWGTAGGSRPSDVQAGEPLPKGLGEAHWGMTAEELVGRLGARKVDSSDQFGYAEHMERDPEVYVGTTADGKRVEYYLYDHALYKLFIIHARNQREPQLYGQMVVELTARYGTPQHVYEESVFGLTITHTVWQDAVTRIDLRYGGGFVFEVHTDRVRAAAKDAALKRKKSI